jgi:hypothetical protein
MSTDRFINTFAKPANSAIRANRMSPNNHHAINVQHV